MANINNKFTKANLAAKAKAEAAAKEAKEKAAARAKAKAEEEARKEAERVAKEKAEKEEKRLKAIEKMASPINEAKIQEAMKLVADGQVHVIRDDNGNAVGLSKRANGMMVHIDGMGIFVGGVNQKDVEEGVKAAIFHFMTRDSLSKVDIAEQLVDSGAKDKDIKQIEDNLIINFKTRAVINTVTGESVVDLSDVEDKLSRTTIEKLLTERLHNLNKEEDYQEEDENEDENDEVDSAGEAYSLGYEDGRNDASDGRWKGYAYNPDQVDPEVEDHYENGYAEGFDYNRD